MDFVWKLYGNTYAVHVTVALVGVATLNLVLPAPPPHAPNPSEWHSNPSYKFSNSDSRTTFTTPHDKRRVILHWMNVPNRGRATPI